MGRIAEALKKAEQERLARPDVVAGRGIAPAETPMWPLAGSEAAEGDDAQSAPDPDAVVEGMSESLVAYYDRSSVLSEQYRALRTRLLSQNQHNEHRVLAITSSVPREGKTITAVNLAFTLAEVRHFNVLVVDADFRRSSLAKVLGLSSTPGLSDLLTNNATYPEVIQKTVVPNLQFIASGELNGHNATELLSAITTRSVFRWFESQYHFTIVDTPPATTVTDAGIIGQNCSGVIMVVRMHHTPEQLAKRAVRLLQVNNVPVVGGVLVGRGERGSGDEYRLNYCRYDNFHGAKGDRR